MSIGRQRDVVDRKRSLKCQELERGGGGQYLEAARIPAHGFLNVGHLSLGPDWGQRKDSVAPERSVSSLAVW